MLWFRCKPSAITSPRRPDIHRTQPVSPLSGADLLLHLQVGLHNQAADVARDEDAARLKVSWCPSQTVEIDQGHTLVVGVTLNACTCRGKIGGAAPMSVSVSGGGGGRRQLVRVLCGVAVAQPCRNHLPRKLLLE